MNINQMTKKLLPGFISILLLTFLVLVVSSGKPAPNQIPSVEKGIELNWKLEENDSLYYRTVMTTIGESSFDIDFGGLFDKITDSTDTKTDEFGKKFFNKLKDHYNQSNMVSILTNSEYFDDVINIEMVVEQKKETEGGDDKGEVIKMMESMLTGIMLRGSIHKNGSLHSFWMQGRQKNLLSLFFELPAGSVNKGDSWTMENVSFISNDQNFICRTAEKKNLVTLTDIKVISGETIAVMDYDILESVTGDFLKQKSAMKFIYKARAEFSLDRGKWISYNGIMSLEASGIMNSKQKQKFALIEL